MNFRFQNRNTGIDSGMKALLSFLTDLVVGVTEAARFWAGNREGQAAASVQAPPKG